MWISVLLIGLPLIEISLFVTVGAWLGLWPTLAIVIGTAIAGMWLIRTQGSRASADMRAALLARKSPAQGLVGDVARVAAGMLLILPGFLTDVLGLLLLLPPIQREIASRLADRARGHVGAHLRAKAWDAAAMRRDRTRPEPDVIDATWEELPEPPAPEDGAGRKGSGWTRH